MYRLPKLTGIRVVVILGLMVFGFMLYHITKGALNVSHAEPVHRATAPDRMPLSYHTQETEPFVCFKVTVCEAPETKGGGFSSVRVKFTLDNHSVESGALCMTAANLQVDQEVVVRDTWILLYDNTGEYSYGLIVISQKDAEELVAQGKLAWAEDEIKRRAGK